MRVGGHTARSAIPIRNVKESAGPKPSLPGPPIGTNDGTPVP